MNVKRLVGAYLGLVVGVTLLSVAVSSLGSLLPEGSVLYGVTGLVFFLPVLLTIPAGLVLYFPYVIGVLALSSWLSVVLPGYEHSAWAPVLVAPLTLAYALTSAGLNVAVGLGVRALVLRLTREVAHA